MAGHFLIQKLSSRVSRSTSALATGPTWEGGIRAPINLFHGATTHPSPMVPSNRWIHGNAAMCLNTCPCSRVAAKTNCATGLPSIMVTVMQPVFAYSISGSKRAFSSTASVCEVSVKAKTACSKDGWKEGINL